MLSIGLNFCIKNSSKDNLSQIASSGVIETYKKYGCIDQFSLKVHTGFSLSPDGENADKVFVPNLLIDLHIINDHFLTLQNTHPHAYFLAIRPYSHTLHLWEIQG